VTRAERATNKLAPAWTGVSRSPNRQTDTYV